MRRATSAGIAAIIAGVAATAHAAPAVRTLIGDIGRPDANGVVPVELVLTNGGEVVADLPERIDGALEIAGVRTAVTLEQAPGQMGSRHIRPGGFGAVRYLLRVPAATASPQTAMLVLPGIGERNIALDLAEPKTATATADTAAPVAAQLAQSFASPNVDSGNGFLANLSAYEPIYAVYGPGTSSDARLQISFKYQLFGRAGAGRSLLEGVHFGYTQRLFWDLGKKSSPFRNVDYMPELFYLVPARPVGDTITLGGRAGIRHESNGRDGLASRSLNTVYIQPVVTMPVGSYRLSLGPRLWTYFGDLSDNPRIKRYRGNTGLTAEIGRDDGLRLTTTARLNFGSGKGSIDSELSYPLDSLTSSAPKLYVFGQAFAGYGENLLDYDRRQTRLRIGFGIVR